MAAAQGASLKELTERMGHSSPRAALIYWHAGLLLGAKFLKYLDASRTIDPRKMTRVADAAAERARELGK